MMKFGLLDTEIENIHKIFSQNQEIKEHIKRCGIIFYKK